MRRIPFVILSLIIISCTSAAQAYALRGSVFLMPVDTSFQSVGEAQYLDDLGRVDSRGVLSGEHRVNQITPAVIFTGPVQGNGSYSYTLAGPADPGRCYGTLLHVAADPGTLLLSKFDQTWTGDTRCAPDTPPPPQPPPGGGGGGGDDTFDSSAASGDPLLISLNGSYDLSGLEDPVFFDINGVGHTQTIGWTARNADVAFLALDRNGNGRIDDGSELFGNATPMGQGVLAANGFDALAQYDANGDGVIDASDPVWRKLLLWVDANHNGVSERNELRPITDSSLTAIDLQHRWTGRRDAYGNHFGYEGRLRQGNRAMQMYDVFFVKARQP